VLRKIWFLQLPRKPGFQQGIRDIALIDIVFTPSLQLAVEFDRQTSQLNVKWLTYSNALRNAKINCKLLVDRWPIYVSVK
jgi:hypothetical protein